MSMCVWQRGAPTTGGVQTNYRGVYQLQRGYQLQGGVYRVSLAQILSGGRLGFVSVGLLAPLVWLSKAIISHLCATKARSGDQAQG